MMPSKLASAQNSFVNMTTNPAHRTAAMAESTVGGAAPTNVRYRILVLTFILAFIMYLDRASIAYAAPYIMREFNLNKISWGWSVSMFNVAYALFQVPGGWMADRFGPRIVLAAA